MAISKSANLTDAVAFLLSGPSSETFHAAGVVLCVINVAASFVAAVTNGLIMVTIFKTPSLHTPSSMLIFSLALADFLVGCFVQPTSIAMVIAFLNKRYSLFRTGFDITFTFGMYFSYVSLVTVAAISVERYLTLIYHLRYTSLVTTKRAIAFCLVMWIFLLPIAFQYWLIGVRWFGLLAFSLCCFFGVLPLVAIPIAYWRILSILRVHMQQIQNLSNVRAGINGAQPMNILKYRKSVLAMLYVVVALVIGYLPFGTYSLILGYLVSITESAIITYLTMLTLVFLNSSINPIIYCVRMGEFRAAVKSVCRQGFNACKSVDSTCTQRLRRPKHSVEVIQIDNLP